MLIDDSVFYPDSKLDMVVNSSAQSDIELNLGRATQTYQDYKYKVLKNSKRNANKLGE